MNIILVLFFVYIEASSLESLTATVFQNEPLIIPRYVFVQHNVSLKLNIDKLSQKRTQIITIFIRIKFKRNPCAKCSSCFRPLRFGHTQRHALRDDFPIALIQSVDHHAHFGLLFGPRLLDQLVLERRKANALGARLDLGVLLELRDVLFQFLDALGVFERKRFVLGRRLGETMRGNVSRISAQLGALAKFRGAAGR